MVFNSVLREKAIPLQTPVSGRVNPSFSNLNSEQRREIKQSRVFTLSNVRGFLGYWFISFLFKKKKCRLFDAVRVSSLGILLVSILMKNN